MVREINRRRGNCVPVWGFGPIPQRKVKMEHGKQRGQKWFLSSMGLRFRSGTPLPRKSLVLRASRVIHHPTMVSGRYGSLVPSLLPLYIGNIPLFQPPPSHFFHGYPLNCMSQPCFALWKHIGRTIPSLCESQTPCILPKRRISWELQLVRYSTARRHKRQSTCTCRFTTLGIVATMFFQCMCALFEPFATMCIFFLVYYIPRPFPRALWNSRK